MIQSLKLLQVNAMQLELLVREELELNPVLELAESEDDTIEDDVPSDQVAESSQLDDDEPASAEDEVDWEEYLDDSLEYNRNTDTYEAGQEFYEPSPVYQKNLDEYLEEQIADKKFDEKEILLIKYIIGCLDPDGYLRQPLEQVAEFASVNVLDAEDALSIVQTLDPPGVGARDLAECLSIQLHRAGLDDSVAMKIITEEWALFEKMKIPEIARRLGVEPRDVQAALEVIRHLNPKPGYSVSPDRPSSIIPDLIVEKVEGEWLVMINDKYVPSLHISRTYAEMMRRGSTATKETKQYIREKFNGATWLIRAIEQRRTTMTKVMYAILDKQKVFFEQGPPNLAPLKLQDVADVIGMHISTISRVTNGKYAQTPHGVFELKYFFTEALGQDETGADISTSKIKSRLAELVAAEDKSDPLSDQRIAETLVGEGFVCARRTVAKYREQLKILPARMRLVYQ